MMAINNLDNGDTVAAKSEGAASKMHPQPWCGQHLANSENITKNTYNYTNLENKDKTPMCRIAELARFHKLKHEYKLLDESGPAHKKLFTVQLILAPEEKFVGSGASIRKAQQAAAQNALDSSEFSSPPEKNNNRRKKDGQTFPVFALANIAASLGLPEPVYRDFSSHAMGSHVTGFIGLNNFNNAPMMPTPTSLFNDAQHSLSPPGQAGRRFSPLIPPLMAATKNGFSYARGPHMSPVIDGRNRMHVVQCCIGGNKMFTGYGPSPSIARQNAAAQALAFLGPSVHQQCENPDNNFNGNIKTDLEDENQNQDEIPKHRQKSVISQVHECAHHMRLNVEFEVLEEDGPPHDRHYVVKCTMKNTNDQIVAESTGEGRKKKEATQTACLNILTKVQGMRAGTQNFLTTLYRQHKKQNTKEAPKRKTIVKDMKMDPSYGHQINPVSRLIQILQVRGEAEPSFNFVGEQGQSRHKEFIVEVCCLLTTCTGSGPNKRLAKRAAAEAMLEEMGYVKPLPAPGKSLLKKKEPLMDIGVFDINDLNSELENVSISDVDNCCSVVVPTETCNEAAVNTDEVMIGEDFDETSSPGSRRRVTFNSQVRACPPPDDAKYPEPEIGPLKADVFVEGRLKRIRKSKEGKRSLTDEQKEEIAASATIFIHNFCSQKTIGTENPAELHSANMELAAYQDKYKFSVQYTNFPKSPDGSDEKYFALVSLGLETPLVCHGSGNTVDAAADNAAYNAICSLSKISSPQV